MTNLFESSSEITRDVVMGAYRKFVELGISNQDKLDLDDPEVTAAHELFEQWCEQEDMKAQGNDLAENRVNFERTMFYIDAGFIDPVYVEEVLGWVEEDLSSIPETEEYEKLRTDMNAAIDRMKKISEVK